MRFFSHKNYLFLSLALLAASFACSTPSSIRPVGKNKNGIGLSLGGPLFSNLGKPLPVPEISVGYRRGLQDNWDVYGVAGLSSSLFGGLPLQIGTTYHILGSDSSWGWGFGGGLLTLTTLRNSSKSGDGLTRLNSAWFFVLPYGELLSSFQFQNRHLLYAHLMMYVSLPPASDPALTGATGLLASAMPYATVLPILSLGHSVPVNDSQRFSYEVFWGGIGTNWYNATLAYSPSLPTGTLGIRFGYQINLGGN